ncbi:Membrane protein involved in the export of O-antigen and teichoic acid [Bryocella elongata]|uniref:Membrane protein involved in the export of O-antigen and teichoic acid n=1 Tax=Bryocella elongata TaxID=863522 RepID=A0A1H5TT72_9BACT|nr:flippase [Bryocella elongata]SEF65241.1 Membrane protein involved in the export of O-antigen and teichoic acid [Bryocella elongata]
MAGGTLKRDTLWMMGGNFLSLGFQAVYFVLIGRAIGSTQYGLFVGVASFLSVFGQFSTMGMELILVRDVSRDREHFARYWGTSLRVILLGFVVTTTASLALGRFFLDKSVYHLIPGIAVADLLFAKIALMASKAFQGVGDFARSANVSVLTNVSKAITAACLYGYVLFTKMPSSAQTWTHVYWIASMVSAVVAFALVTIYIGPAGRGHIDRRSLVEGLGFMTSNSSISIYNDIDKTILVSRGMDEAAGTYSAAYRIVDVASSPIYSVYSAAFPAFFREGAKGMRYAMQMALKISRKTIPFSLAAAGLMFVSAGLLPYIFGQSFAGSVAALRWLCLLPLIRSLHYAGGMTLTASVSQWYRTVQQVFVALLNVGLNLWLIPHYSWRGAAAASLISDGTLAALNWISVLWLMRSQERRWRAAASQA